MHKKVTLNFNEQAKQMLHILQDHLQTQDQESAWLLLKLKFKSLYELGVSAGRSYEKEGVYPYTSLD